MMTISPERKVGHEHTLDIGLEAVTVDRTVQHYGRYEAAQPQTLNESRCFPVAVPNGLMIVLYSMTSN
ncbi:hypothetical protein A0U92_04440 [Acetobacter aceti]|uniref:Uncharacterized protein n=1 Tax=Acetobacter aceti TaxID=435 RepID=A0A1U9KEB0_ACEAC|nr:hypothetical protein A0U92_04440 [Acetobacter aceti]